MWKKELCLCGLGEDHFHYEREDGAFVSRDHSSSGTQLKPSWISRTNDSRDINPHRAAEAAMKKLDSLYPPGMDIPICPSCGKDSMHHLCVSHVPGSTGFKKNGWYCEECKAGPFRMGSMTEDKAAKTAKAILGA